MKIVIVPSGFKECLDAEEVALVMERGVRRVHQFIDMEIILMIDGGEGFAKTIVNIKGGEDLMKVDSIVTTNIDRRLHNVSIDVVCNWKNILCNEETQLIFSCEGSWVFKVGCAK
jgi:glycerate kinase